jgi:predicted DNA-binding transcriptional regulator AlpA
MTAKTKTVAYLSRGQMAEILGVSRWTMGELARGEGFPTAIALGPRTLRYRKDEFYSWCEARRAAAKPARSNYSPVKRDEPSRFRAIVVAA